MGYQPASSLSRDLFSMSRLIDQWSQLGVQLHVTLACPSSMELDRSAKADLEATASAPGGPWTEADQEQWLAESVGLLLAKPAVTGVFMSHLSDALPHRYPNAGLLRADGQPKPAWARLGAVAK